MFIILLVDMGICVKLNKVITLAVVFLAGLWFLLVVLLPHSGQGPPRGEVEGWRVESIVHPLGQAGADEGLQLLEVINHGVPNIFGSEGILLVTSEWSRVDYSYLLYSLSSLKLLGEKYRFPVYVLRQRSNHNFYNHRTVQVQGRALQGLIARCLQQHNIKRLSVIAYEQSALMTLMALSQADSSFIFRIDKLILINPFNPANYLYQNDAKSLSKMIKRQIMEDRLRLVAFHYLRIIIINTFRTVQQEEPESRDHFNFAFVDTQGERFLLNSTLAISSKALFDISEYIERGTYFTHKSFVNLLMRVIIDDQKSKLSLRSIEYILRYREGTEGNEREGVRLSSCRVLFLEQLSRSGVEVRSQCLRILQRQRHKFAQGVLLLYSAEKIEIYTEDLHRLPASVYRSNKVHTAVVSDLAAVTEVVLFAGERPVHLLVTIVRSPLNNPFPLVDAEDGVRVVTGQEIVLIQSCEGWRPIIGLGLNEHFKQLVEWRTGDCYIQLQDYNSYSEWFGYNWTVIRNVIIFSLFSSHALAAYTYRRYYTTLFINLVLLLFLLNKVYFFENLILTSTATLIEIIAMVLLKASQWLHISTHYYLAVVLLPLASELCARAQIGFALGNSGKLLLVQVAFVNHQAGYLITLIKCYFMLDIYATQQPSLYSLALLAVWQASRIPGSPLRLATTIAKTKGKLADMLFLGMLCFSLSQEGSVIHQLVNFYMITHLLMGAGEAANRVMDNH